MDSMNRWIREYDSFRTNPYEKNQSWHSTKYDIEGLHWTEIASIYLPEVDMCWGPACSALKKSWYAFKKSAGFRGDLAYRINSIQDSMGIPVTDFEEYPYEEWENL